MHQSAISSFSFSVFTISIKSWPCSLLFFSDYYLIFHLLQLATGPKINNKCLHAFVNNLLGKWLHVYKHKLARNLYIYVYNDICGYNDSSNPFKKKKRNIKKAKREKTLLDILKYKHQNMLCRSLVCCYNIILKLYLFVLIADVRIQEEFSMYMNVFLNVVFSCF